MDRRPDRMREFLNRINIPDIKRFSAIDGKELDTTPEIQYLFRNNNFNNHPSVIGCDVRLPPTCVCTMQTVCRAITVKQITWKKYVFF